MSNLESLWSIRTCASDGFVRQTEFATTENRDAAVAKAVARKGPGDIIMFALFSDQSGYFYEFKRETPWEVSP